MTSNGSIKFERRTQASGGIPSFAASTVASTNQSYHGGGGHSHGYSEGSSGSSGGGGHGGHISSSSKYGQHYTSLYATPTTATAPSSVSSSTSRRLTVSGASAGHGHGVHGSGSDLPAYYGSGSGSGGGGGGSSTFSSASARKNATSMYVTGSSNTIGVATGADYLRQVNANSSAAVTANSSFGHGSSGRG